MLVKLKCRGADEPKVISVVLITQVGGDGE